MNNVLDWAKPHQRFFEEMTRIPHGSENEQEYSDKLINLLVLWPTGFRHRSMAIEGLTTASYLTW